MNTSQNSNSSPNKFGLLLKKYRTHEKLSANELARIIGIDPSYINRLESGERQPPKRDIVINLARALNLDSDETDKFLIAADYSPIYPDQLLGLYNGLKVINSNPTLRLFTEALQNDEIDQTDLKLIESIIINIKSRKKDNK